MQHTGKVALVDDPEHIALPLWRESFTGMEYLRLKTSKVYYGYGVPQGQGEPVVIVPGFMGSDFYLVELYLWLRRIGYQPYFSRIGHNAKCPDVLTQRLIHTVGRAYRKSGNRRVHLIGHSLGGVFARGAASGAPDQVASVITLASPFRGLRVNGLIQRTIELVRARMRFTRRGRMGCYTAACTCGFTAMMRGDFPAHIPQTCLYTKTDGIVDWTSCLNDNPDTDIEIQGTHIGVVWNADAYKIIANRLRAAEAFLAEAQATRRKQAAAREATAAAAQRNGHSPRAKAS